MKFDVRIVICILLVGLVFIVFGQTIGYGFINYDDGGYVYENPMVAEGLSPEGVEWAFTHFFVGHWHPLTVIVLMLESEVFGLRPGGYHLVNVLLHAASVVCLFLLLLEMTGAFWRSAFVAAVFGIHPLRAESVAWISECKDVLSGLFFMLTLWAYVRYTRSAKSRGRYVMVLLWFALGLLSKPMLVTVPCVLLLLDYWPLRRLRGLSQFPALLLEKTPFFILSGLSSLATVLAIKSGDAPVASYPANAPIAYVDYLGKLILPISLTPLYPLPMEGSPPWQVFDAILVLAVLTAGAWLLRRKRPYMATGWFWYLGMLVPVIGVMQTGNQAYADRYTYLPQIGLCFAGTWMAADWAGQRHYRRRIIGAIAAVILCALLFAGWHQTAYWRDSATLWRHTIECTRDNFVAHNNLGNALLEQGHAEEAIGEYRDALRINPAYPGAHDDLGSALLKLGRIDEAIAECRKALQIEPSDTDAHYNLATALLQSGQTDQAIAEYRVTLRIDPGYIEARNNLANALLQQGHVDDSIAEYREALRLNPAYAETRYNLGNALFHAGRNREAISEYREALRIQPRDPDTHYSLGVVLFQQGAINEAINETQIALELEPANAEIQNNLAWMLATAPQAAFRDGPRALELALKASQASGDRNPNVLRTLAAAYAQTDDFADALQTAQSALRLAAAQSRPDIADALRGDIKLYGERHRP